MNPYKRTFIGQFFDHPSAARPDEAIDLNELVKRFTRGERLLVNNRPVNFFETGEDGEFLHGIKDEDYDNVLPQIEDPVDLEDFQRELANSKNDLLDKKKKKQNNSNDLNNASIDKSVDDTN